MPAETSPTMRPSDAYTGATARIDGPSVPVKTSLNVSPRSAGSVVPRYVWPISDGSVCVYRVPSGDMIVMNAIWVSCRTFSVTGWRAPVGSPDWMAVAVDGAAASDDAMATTRSRAASSPSRRASRAARAPPRTTMTRTMPNISAAA